MRHACRSHAAIPRVQTQRCDSIASFAVLALSVPLLLSKAASLDANSGPVTFAYDAAGRLIGVVDGAGNTAQYNYDAVGNLLSISHPTGVYIFSASPNNGPAMTVVTIYGDNFSPTPSQNTVKFGSTTATVTSSTLTTIVTSVPSGATQGITVTAPGGSYTCWA